MKKGFAALLTLVIMLTIVFPAMAYTGFPTFSIETVVVDKSVTIKTENLPSNDTFTVTMGKIGTRGVDGVEVGTTESGPGGTLTFTYNIPDSLVGLSMISIRLESPTAGYFAYNWFWNTTATTTPEPTQIATPTPNPTVSPTQPGYSGFPTFTISAVVSDTSVTITGKNFPPNDTFDVLVGEYGTKGIDGIKVGSADSGAGGDLTATYQIPSDFAGNIRIAIRLESPTSGYFAYNWFWNSTTP